MKRRNLILLALALMLTGMLACAGALADEVMYVRTNNGGHLNVRALPMVEGDIVGRLSYGDEVTVYGHYDDYVEIKAARVNLWGYVAKRYLSSRKPAPIPSGGGGGGSSGGGDASSAFSSMNYQFRSMQPVGAYTVYVRPSRPGGFVNLRWAPTTEAEVQQRCYANYELEVMAVGNSWYQVRDIRTGSVGFIMKSFVQ